MGWWYFAFLMIFVLLVTTVGRSLVVTAVAVAQQPTGFLDMLASWLPRTSHYYFNYVIIGWFTLAWELIRAPVLLKYWCLRFLYRSEPSEAKRYSEPEDEATYGLGARMGLSSLMSAITLVFCTCSPLMLLFSAVYFTIGRWAYAFLLVHAETRKPDLGGVFWVEAVRQMLFILCLFVMLMTGVMVAHFNTFWCGPAAVSIGALLPVYMFWRRINMYEWRTLPLEQMMKAWHAGENALTRQTSEEEESGAPAKLQSSSADVAGGGAALLDAGAAPARTYRQPECMPLEDAASVAVVA